jgi:glycerophosphoryl diester phosphodiesterase
MVQNDLSPGEKMSARPLIIGHRGDSAHAPENTLAALQMAVDKGADGVEFDVRMSGDNVPVVIHDATLERTGGRQAMVAELTADELAKIDVGSWFNAKYERHANSAFASETVPDLQTVLERLRNFSGLIYVEIKCGPAGNDRLVKVVCEILRDSPQLPQFIVKSFTLSAIAKVRCHLPEVQTAALFAPGIMDFLRRKKHIVALAGEFGAHQLSLHRSLAGRGLISRAADAGMPVTVWTANKTRWIKHCRDLGIKAVITNDPAKMIAARAAYADDEGNDLTS